MLAVAALARASAATLAGEVTLLRELRTPPLPKAHVPVGSCWQNNRCCQPPSAAAQLPQRPRVAPELVSRLTGADIAMARPGPPIRAGGLPIAATGQPITGAGQPITTPFRPTNLILTATR